MNANELMIGDWVIVYEKSMPVKAKVEGVYGKMATVLGQQRIVEKSFIEPIPLTPEILEKNGFISGDFYAELLYKDWQIMSDCEHLAARCRDGWNFDIPCQFVHELQHALRLCGIEKEIEI